MQKLPEKVIVVGTGIPNLTSTLVERTKKKAVYLRSDDVYEVFYIQIHPQQEIYGNSYPEREAYPCNEDFGQTAWTYTTRQKAMERYAKL